MDANRIDSLVRLAANSLSRRGVLGLVLTGLAGALGITPVTAKKHKRRGNKGNKPRTNAFGCLNVGQKCRGDDNKCCSGICQGKKPKKGEKDKSRCVAHNAATCQPNQDSCIGNELDNIPCGTGGSCFRTTGNASFCGVEEQGNCVICAKDKDCEPVFGAGAACIVCGACEEGSGGTGCVPPAPSAV